MTAREGGSRVALLWTLVAVIVLALSASVIAWTLMEEAASNGARPAHLARSDAAAPPKPPRTILKPLSKQDAIAENAAIPLSTELLEAAVPFMIGNAADAVIARSAARDCLAAAIYYEAAAESEQGQRGVAQVVLNRVRHPAFPSSVCQVVYQGADRKTGCQFTFTCDGSLARTPTSSGWARASRIAAEALDGKVEPSVGMATHYHANYVVPYWASSLTKIAAIGTHIFYRWSGQWGKRRAFVQVYSGENTSAASIAPADVLTSLDAGAVELTSGSHDPLARGVAPHADAATRLPEPPASGPLKADEARPNLLADEKRPFLVIDARDGIID